MDFSSAILPSELLFKPQGTHPGTGQALPPLLNNRERNATGEDIASLSRSDCRTPFAFQVVNNTYNRTGASGVTLRTPPPARPIDKARGEVKKKKKRIQQRIVSSNFAPRSATVKMTSGSNPSSLSFVIPRSAKKVIQILAWWVKGDPSIGLMKSLMLWTPDERNSSYEMENKIISNRLLYAKRKTVAMVFFHFCSQKSVVDYEKTFTSIHKTNFIARNYSRSSKYAKDNNLATQFKESEHWVNFTRETMKKNDVKKLFETKD